MLATRRNFGATSNRVPGSVGPLNTAVVAHARKKITTASFRQARVQSNSSEVCGLSCCRLYSAVMTSLDCARCGRRTPHGNCPQPLADRHVVQCVGVWAEHQKHSYLRAFIEATREARRKFKTSGFIDLFAGPGKVRLRDTGEVCDGSPLLALNHEAVPFTHAVLCDLAAENVAALRHRTAQYRQHIEILHGDSNARIYDLVALLPRGLNLALVDPFGLGPLHFKTIETLAQAEKLDLFVNFPTSDLRRNQALYLDSSNPVVARAIGVSDWRERLGTGDIAIQAANMFVDSLTKLGYTGAQNRMIKVARSGSELYRIIFASKHQLADKIWSSITRNTPSGQRGFGF